MEDILIMQRIQQGDRSAFAELYTKYNQLAFNTALLYTTDQQRALTMVKAAFRDVYNFVLANGPYTGDMQAWLHALLISQNTQAQPSPPPQPPQQNATYIHQPIQQQGAEYWQQPSPPQYQPIVRDQSIYGKRNPNKERKQKAFKPWYKRVWVWVVTSVVVLSIASSLGDESEKPDAVAPPAPTIGEATGNAPSTNAEAETAPPSTTDTPTAAPEAYTEISATDLITAYDENAVGADNAYKGKLLKVTGRIDSIGKDIADRAYVTLHDERNDFALISVQCYFKTGNLDDIATLKKDDTVSIIGTCDGGSLNVVLRNCEVAG